jgi:hypothetical protein
MNKKGGGSDHPISEERSERYAAANVEAQAVREA